MFGNPLSGVTASGFLKAAGNATNNVLNWIDGGTRGYSSYDATLKNTYNTAEGYAKAAKYVPQPKASPTSTAASVPPVDNSWMQSLNAQLAALQAQVAAQPKLPKFDILANYNKAKQTANDAVTPLYNKKLDLFLESQGIKKNTKTQEKNLSLENNSIALNNALGDNATSRNRTGEDLASALAQIGQGRSDFLVDDGNAFDQSRRALQEEIAAGGGTDTGLGQQAIQQQQNDRNTGADRQLREFNNQEAAKNLLATRTLDDLATSDTRQTQKKGQDDKAVQIDFDGYMASLANEENTFRLTNDLDKALAIAQQTQSYEQQGVNQFIAGLANSGWRAQDIALAKQVYG